MARVYSRDSFEVKFDTKHADNIRDVAQALSDQIQEQDCKFSIDVIGLLGSFIDQCGAVIKESDKE